LWKLSNPCVSTAANLRQDYRLGNAGIPLAAEAAPANRHDMVQQEVA
jgi:hypothetical protein